MSLPVVVPVMTVDIKGLVLSDSQPTPSSGYEIVLLKDLGYTKLWQEFKVTGA